MRESVACLLSLNDVSLNFHACLAVILVLFGRMCNQEVNGGYSGRMIHEERIDDLSHENVYEDVNDIIFNSSGKQGVCVLVFVHAVLFSL